MSMWIVHMPGLQAEAGAEAHMPLPIEPTQNFTRAQQPDDIRRALRAANPALPPEAAASQAERLWRLLHGVQAEDTLIVPLASEGRMVFATVLQAAQFEEIADKIGRYMLHIRWSKRSAPLRRFRKYRQELEPKGELFTPAEPEALRRLVRDALRLPGGRYGALAWIFGLLFLLQMFNLALRQWDSIKH